MLKIFYTILLIGMSANLYATCYSCVCTESSSPTKNIEYDNEVKKVNKEKVETKIDEISKKAERIKDLQKQLNEKLAKLQSLEVQEYILHKKKNFEIEQIIVQASVNGDINTTGNKATMERIKSKLNILSKKYNDNLNNQLSDYLK